MQTSVEISIENPTAGGCRLILRIKHQDRPGFQRIAQDITADMLTSIVLFAEALRAAPHAVEQNIEIGSLSLAYNATNNALTLSRTLGNATQDAQTSPEDLIQGLTPAVSAALSQAQDSPEGAFIANHLSTLVSPSNLAGSDLDSRLRDIYVIFLAAETRRKGSPLVRNIRSKTKHDVARRDIAEVFYAITGEIQPAHNPVRATG